MINMNSRFQRAKGTYLATFRPILLLSSTGIIINNMSNPNTLKYRFSQIKKYIKKEFFFYKDGELENGTNSSALENGRKKMDKRIKATLK